MISKMVQMEAVDLFCGIGGLTKGLESAGIPVRVGFDIDETCEFCYTSNTGSKFVNCDVAKLNTREIHQYFCEDSSIKIIAGCAPCQPFSRLSGKYRQNGYKDEKWRLLYAFARIVNEERPQIVTMENVPDLQEKQVFKDFVTELEDAGYSTYYNIVYCPDYLIPQKRKRLVLLASQLGEIKLIDPLCNKDEYLTVRDAISDLPPIKAGEKCVYDPMHRACGLSNINMRRIRQSVPDGTWDTWDDDLKLKCHRRKTGATYKSVYGRMSWDQPSPTITTQFYGYGNGRFGHPEQDRAISLREGALLQTFPRDYIFLEEGKEIKLHELGVHIGNAVPVQLGKVIGESIVRHVVQAQGGYVDE